jgi:hypothetical protein
LKVGQGFSEAAAMQTARKFLGVTNAEIERLTERILEVLGDDALDPRELKERVGDAARSLGAEGKKRGTTTTLPLALGNLQSEGRLRRVPVNGRLDQQRYAYRRWSPSPLQRFSLSREEALTELARRYWRWIGPASLAHFQWFSGLGKGAAKEAVAPLELTPVEAGSELMLLPDDTAELEAFQPPTTPVYALVASIDGMSQLRRDDLSLVADEDRNAPVADEKGLRPLSELKDPPCHMVLDRGRLIGQWEFDPAEGRIVHRCFAPATEALSEVILRTEAYVRDELGDARSFSLDSPESRQPRLAALRAR